LVIKFRIAHMSEMAVYYIMYLMNIIWKLLQKKTKVFGFVGTDHLRTKIVINDETVEHVSQFTYSRLQYILPIFPTM